MLVYERFLSDHFQQLLGIFCLSSSLSCTSSPPFQKGSCYRQECRVERAWAFATRFCFGSKWVGRRGNGQPTKGFGRIIPPSQQAFAEATRGLWLSLLPGKAETDRPALSYSTESGPIVWNLIWNIPSGTDRANVAATMSARNLLMVAVGCTLLPFGHLGSWGGQSSTKSPIKALYQLITWG